MANWYYVISKTREKCGPHDEAFVRSKYLGGEIAPATLVWHDGLVGWIRASEAFASLQLPPSGSGKVPLPDGLRPWMTFVGVATILVFLWPSALLVGIPMLLSGFAILGASASLGRTPFVDADLFPFFARLRTIFCCWGWTYLVALFLSLVAFLLSAAAFFFVAPAGNVLSRFPVP